MSIAATMRAYRRRIAAKICVRCGADARGNGVLCVGCGALNNVKRQARYDDRKARHVCQDCETELPADAEHVRCDDCHWGRKAEAVLDEHKATSA